MKSQPNRLLIPILFIMLFFLTQLGCPPPNKPITGDGDESGVIASGGKRTQSYLPYRFSTAADGALRLADVSHYSLYHVKSDGDLEVVSKPEKQEPLENGMVRLFTDASERNLLVRMVLNDETFVDGILTNEPQKDVVVFIDLVDYCSDFVAQVFRTIVDLGERSEEVDTTFLKDHLMLSSLPKWFRTTKFYPAQIYERVGYVMDGVMDHRPWLLKDEVICDATIAMPEDTLFSFYQDNLDNFQHWAKEQVLTHYYHDYETAVLLLEPVREYYKQNQLAILLNLGIPIWSVNRYRLVLLDTMAETLAAVLHRPADSTPDPFARFLEREIQLQKYEAITQGIIKLLDQQVLPSSTTLSESSHYYYTYLAPIYRAYDQLAATCRTNFDWNGDLDAYMMEPIRVYNESIVMILQDLTSQVDHPLIQILADAGLTDPIYQHISTPNAIQHAYNTLIPLWEQLHSEKEGTLAFTDGDTMLGNLTKVDSYIENIHEAYQTYFQQATTLLTTSSESLLELTPAIQESAPALYHLRMMIFQVLLLLCDGQGTL